MIVDIFKTVLSLSAAGGLLTLVLLLLKPVTEKSFGAVWQYYVWLAALAVMVCPVSLRLPLAVPEKASERFSSAAELIELAETGTINFSEAQDLPRELSLSLAEGAAFLWLAVAAVLLVYKITAYLIFKRTVRKNSQPEFTKGRISVRKTGILTSPLLMGVLKPVLLLPERAPDGKELDCIIAHELMHYKRGDIIYKWVAAFVKCIHWFNPLVYVLTRQIDAECEISCDVMVTKRMDKSEQKLYMKTVLSLMERNFAKKRIPLVSMANNKSLIKKRFKMISGARPLKAHTGIIAGAAALAVCISAVLINSLVMSASVYAGTLPEISEPVEPVEAAETAGITGITEKLLPERQTPAAKKPETEQVKASEPAEAKEEKLTAESPAPTAEAKTQRTEEAKRAEDGKEKAQTDALSTEEAADGVGASEADKALQIKFTDTSEERYVNVEHIPLGEKRDTETMAELIEKAGGEYIKGDFNYADGTRKLITNVKPDENGNITLHFDSYEGEIIQIGVSETDSKKSVWGVHLPADGSVAYSFTGLDKNTEYSISLYSPAKENWKIDSEYLIY